MVHNTGQNRKILITGGTSGLGRELAKLFLSAGCEVYVTGREQKGELLSNDRYHFIRSDFADLQQLSAALKDLIEKSVKFDIIINNAGILSPPDYTTTKDGFEYSFQVNFLSHLLLDEILIGKLTDSANLTIVSVTSPVYKIVNPDFKIPGRSNYRAFKTYAESKYYLLLIGEFFRKRHPGRKLEFVSFDPGTFGSGIYRMQKGYFRFLYRIAAPFMKSPQKVAKHLFTILESGNPGNGKICKRPGKPGINVPVNTEKAAEFLFFCLESIKAMM